MLSQDIVGGQVHEFQVHRPYETPRSFQLKIGDEAIEAPMVNMTFSCGFELKLACNAASLKTIIWGNYNKKLQHCYFPIMCTVCCFTVYNEARKCKEWLGILGLDKLMGNINIFCFGDYYQPATIRLNCYNHSFFH